MLYTNQMKVCWKFSLKKIIEYCKIYIEFSRKKSELFIYSNNCFSHEPLNIVIKIVPFHFVPQQDLFYLVMLLNRVIDKQI